MKVPRTYVALAFVASMAYSLLTVASHDAAVALFYPSAVLVMGLLAVHEWRSHARRRR